MANTSTSALAAAFGRLLSLGASVSLYMAHGGTSFGFWSGANGGGPLGYEPDITSYDYGVPRPCSAVPCPAAERVPRSRQGVEATCFLVSEDGGDDFEG